MLGVGMYGWVHVVGGWRGLGRLLRLAFLGCLGLFVQVFAVVVRRVGFLWQGSRQLFGYGCGNGACRVSHY